MKLFFHFAYADCDESTLNNSNVFISFSTLMRSACCVRKDSLPVANCKDSPQYSLLNVLIFCFSHLTSHIGNVNVLLFVYSIRQRKVFFSHLDYPLIV